MTLRYSFRNIGTRSTYFGVCVVDEICLLQGIFWYLQLSKLLFWGGSTICEDGIEKFDKDLSTSIWYCFFRAATYFVL